MSDPRARRLAALAGGDVMCVALDPRSGAGRFFRLGQVAARPHLGLHLPLGHERLRAGQGERTNPAWLRTGQALRGARGQTAAVPAQGSPPIATAHPTYRLEAETRTMQRTAHMGGG